MRQVVSAAGEEVAAVGDEAGAGPLLFLPNVGLLTGTGDSRTVEFCNRKEALLVTKATDCPAELTSCKLSTEVYL